MANNPNMNMIMAAQARRRRDERGRYMESERPDMYKRSSQYARRNAMPQGYDRSNDMRRSYGRRMEPQPMSRQYNREMDNAPGMGGEGYFVWDNMDPFDYDAPEQYYSPYGDQPDVYKEQEDWNADNVSYMDDYNRSAGAMGMRPQQMHGRQIGFQADEKPQFDKETAMKWVDSMKDSEGNFGGKYSWAQAHQYAISKGYTSDKDIAEFYASMNAMYSDFHKAAEKYGVDKPDFYACLAKLFMDDPDAVDDKVGMYYNYIAKHGN